MRAGRLRDRVILERPKRATDAIGDVLIVWEPVEEIDGSDLPATSREVWRAKQMDAQITGVVSIRFFDGLESSWRLRIDNRILQIAGVYNPDGRKREHLIGYVESPREAIKS